MANEPHCHRSESTCTHTPQPLLTHAAGQVDSQSRCLQARHSRAGGNPCIRSDSVFRRLDDVWQMDSRLRGNDDFPNPLSLLLLLLLNSQSHHWTRGRHTWKCGAKQGDTDADLRIMGLPCLGRPFLLVTFNRRESSRTLGQQRKVTGRRWTDGSCWLLLFKRNGTARKVSGSPPSRG